MLGKSIKKHDLKIIQSNKIKSMAVNRKKLTAFLLPKQERSYLMPNENLEKLKRDQYVVEKKLTAAKHKERQLQSEIKRLTRSERTHRLCTRAGMLEAFLKEPTLLTDDDVMELLIFLFHGEAAQKKLDSLIENRRKTMATDDSGEPLW